MGLLSNKLLQEKSAKEDIRVIRSVKLYFLAHNCIQADEGHLIFAQGLVVQRCRRPAWQTEHTHVQLEKESQFRCVQHLSSYAGQQRIKLTQEHCGNMAKIHPTLHTYEITLRQTTDLKSLALKVEFSGVPYVKGELCCCYEPPVLYLPGQRWCLVKHPTDIWKGQDKSQHSAGRQFTEDFVSKALFGVTKIPCVHISRRNCGKWPVRAHSKSSKIRVMLL